VVQAGMIQDLHHRTDGARFRVIRAVNQAFQPGMDQSAGTHGARLNCSKQFAALQAVVADGGTRFAQRDDLGVGSGVSVAEIAVTSTADDLAITDHDGSHRNFPGIECALGKDKDAIKPTDPEWHQACKIALCAASTHLSLVRHFNWVHLAGGAQLAIATRNSLPEDHALFRLLWPYIFGTLQSNDMVTRGQMAPGGDFETTFSFTFRGMCDLFDDTYEQYEHTVNDPETDGDWRHVRGQKFDTPTQQNLEDLFDVIHRFVRDYLEIFFPESATGAKDIRNDTATLAWLGELNACLPNGVGVDPQKFVWKDFARMLAGQLYLVTVQHEILGSFMWNYQLWTHRQPARIYDDFRGEPLDVYQRLVNANYILNVHRRGLIHNWAIRFIWRNKRWSCCDKPLGGDVTM